MGGNSIIINIYKLKLEGSLKTSTALRIFCSIWFIFKNISSWELYSKISLNYLSKGIPKCLCMNPLCNISIFTYIRQLCFKI